MKNKKKNKTKSFIRGKEKGEMRINKDDKGIEVDIYDEDKKMYLNVENVKDMLKENGRQYSNVVNIESDESEGNIYENRKYNYTMRLFRDDEDKDTKVFLVFENDLRDILRDEDDLSRDKIRIYKRIKLQQGGMKYE